LDQQQATTPPEVAPGTPGEPADLDARIAAKFGLNEPEEAPADPEATPAEGDVEANPEEETPVEEPESEFSWDIKHNGEIKKVSSKDEATRLMQQGFDYEFKMQRVNTDAQRVQAYAHAIQARAAMQAQAFDALVHAKTIEQQLSAFNNVDWAAESNNDPIGAFQKRMQYDHLVSNYNQAQQHAQSLMQPLNQASQQIDEHQIALERGKLFDRYPEWKDEKRWSQDREAMGKTLFSEFTEEELNGPPTNIAQLLQNHKVIGFIRDAMKYRQGQQNAKAGKGNQGAPRTLQPGVKPAARSKSQEMGDIKKALRQTSDPRARKDLEDALVAKKFGLT
jgi:hypothetical protein